MESALLVLGFVMTLIVLALIVADQLAHKHDGPGYVEPWDL